MSALVEPMSRIEHAAIAVGAGPRLYCSSEWHLRKSPRAFQIYSLALRLTKGGSKEFYVSQPQLAEYFGWDLKTVRTAFAALRDSGLFEQLRRGTGGGKGQLNFANVYSVLTHSRFARNTTNACWPQARSPQECRVNHKRGAEKEKTGRPPLPETGASPLPETGTLIFDKSTNKSTIPSRGDGLKRLASPEKEEPTLSLALLPEDFQPDISNEQFAKGKGLDLEEELAIFSDLHRAIGNERPNWQSVFREHLKNTAPKLSKDFRPKDSHGALAQKLGIDFKEHFDAFVDYHLATGKRSLDWDAALNTWLRRAAAINAKRPPRRTEMFDAMEAFKRQR